MGRGREGIHGPGSYENPMRERQAGSIFRHSWYAQSGRIRFVERKAPLCRPGSLVRKTAQAGNILSIALNLNVASDVVDR